MDKTYAIRRDGIEEAPTTIWNGVLVYDLEPLQISWMDFVGCVPAGIAGTQVVEKVVQKVEMFYENEGEREE